MSTTASIPDGAVVFLDANCFVYHFIGHARFGPPCTALLVRIQQGQLTGWTSPFLLAEVSHRLMTIEACTTFGWSYQGIAARLRSHPAQVRQLKLFRSALDEIAQLPLRVVVATPTHVRTAADVSQQFGLLTNDSLLIALMLAEGVTNLASTDADFDRVRGIVRYSPE